MADASHLAALDAGVEAWNAWRLSADISRPDLSELNLSRRELKEIDFRGVVLRRSTLTRADLRGADLSHADLYQAEFYRADLRSAILNSADLSGAKLHNADLANGSLADADLYRVDFIGTILANTNFRGAKCSLTTFAGIDLRSAKALGEAIHVGPSNIDVSTLLRSAGTAADEFLVAAGVPSHVVQYARSLATSPIQFYSCFISYSHVDKNFALRLHTSLEQRGIRCWLDEKQLMPGDDIYDEVDKGIRLWDKVLLCCSRASLSSWWVDNEIGMALEKEQLLRRERDQIVRAIVPVDLDGFLFSDEWRSGYRAQLRRRRAADFTSWENEEVFHARLDQLVRSLRPDESARDRPPTGML